MIGLKRGTYTSNQKALSSLSITSNTPSMYWFSENTARTKSEIQFPCSCVAQKIRSRAEKIVKRFFNWLRNPTIRTLNGVQAECAHTLGHEFLKRGALLEKESLQGFRFIYVVAKLSLANATSFC